MKNNLTNKAKILIIISGPTAVGKTDLTIQLAKKYNSSIFSADSRQLYKELSIGTAKPSKEEMDGIHHYFIDHISIHEPYNIGLYEEEIDSLLGTYFQTNDIGILTGGTGMYIKATLEGLDAFPSVDKSINDSVERRFLKDGLTYLQKELKEKDPEYAAKVDLSNSRRLIRALSVIEASGQTFSSFLNQKKPKQLPFKTLQICLERDRAELYDRINTRVDLMMENGLLEEAKQLHQWKNLRSLQTVGYSELFKYFDGECTLEEAIELIKRNSRRYAKRQMTWFRNQGEWSFFNAEDIQGICDYIEMRIKEFK